MYYKSINFYKLEVEDLSCFTMKSSMISKIIFAIFSVLATSETDIYNKEESLYYRRFRQKEFYRKKRVNFGTCM